MITKEEYDACLDGDLAGDTLNELINEMDIEPEAILLELKCYFGNDRFYEALKYFVRIHDLKLTCLPNDEFCS